ncbi:MAG: disulfide bond formation protein DsbA [Alphaproteobacteria bacterium CG_4_9_14_3_um_filter_47_13]|nr:MAG: disulfide bond formation protein DsbA [Alphaproteobacteria bacterium CG_4_9_14_3_um_filter_47_13]
MMNRKIIGITALAAIIALTMLYMTTSSKTVPQEQSAVTMQTANLQSSPTELVTPVDSVIDSEPSAGEQTTETLEEAETIISSDHVINVEEALKPREMGATDAPVLIEEYASLSCSHCAQFSRETFEKLKEAYIDTGKVRFIYNDYPLNAPAMDAAMVARCLPEDRYFKFVKFLFETQENWAFEADYKKKLVQNAKLSGATEELVNACLENQELKQGLITRMQKAAEDHNIQSTPSFIINGTETLKGAQDFESFSKAIDARLEESPAAP